MDAIRALGTLVGGHPWPTLSSAPARLPAAAAVLVFALAGGQCAAFESNEHREIGNCALVVAHHMIRDMAAKTPEAATRDEIVLSMGNLLPNEEPGGQRSPLCRLSGDTNGFSDWKDRVFRGNLQIEPDQEGRRIWTKSSGDSIVTYGQLASLVDSYAYPLRLVALRARAAAADARSDSLARHYGALPEKPRDLFANGGRLPWPEDVRALDVNDSHFRGLAVLSYVAAHKLAREEATREPPNYYGALVANAIADHYLLDLFAPGHVMAARQTIPGELVLGMHDYANKVGVPFILDHPAQVQNLLVVLHYIRTNFDPLFGPKLALPQLRDREELEKTFRVVSGQLDALNGPEGWLAVGRRVLQRGDNFLTYEKMADKKLGVQQSRQYLLVLAVQVLSIMDAVLSGNSLCPLHDCGALAEGFVAHRPTHAPQMTTQCPAETAASGMDWIEPQPCTEEGLRDWRISSPRARMCCGIYALVDVDPQLFDFSPVTSDRAKQLLKVDKPRARTAGEGTDYSYPNYDNIVGVSYQREYGHPAHAPYGVAISLGFLVRSFSGEIMDLQQVPDVNEQDKKDSDSAWQSGVVSLRLDPNCFRGPGRCGHYGIESRLVTSLSHSPWRGGAYFRYGRYHNGQGERHADNGAGVLLELTSTFFRFAVTLGARGFPLLERSNRHYGFEVGFLLPQSRWPIFGTK